MPDCEDDSSLQVMQLRTEGALGERGLAKIQIQLANCNH